MAAACQVTLAASRARPSSSTGRPVLQLDGTHYAAFLEQHETIVAAELDFLRAAGKLNGT